MLSRFYRFTFVIKKTHIFIVAQNELGNLMSVLQFSPKLALDFLSLLKAQTAVLTIVPGVTEDLLGDERWKRCSPSYRSS